MGSGRAILLATAALAAVACAPGGSAAGTLAPFARGTGTPPPLTSVDDTTFDSTPLRVNGGATVEFFGRSVPGAAIEVVTALPACSGGFREQTARSVVPADGSYRVAVKTEPRWTRLDVRLRFVSKGGDQTVTSDIKTITILPAGRTPYCS
jgi:hypothetical protein